jgi:hypothetical protein
MKFSCIPPKPESKKVWHGLNRNQGVEENMMNNTKCWWEFE